MPKEERKKGTHLTWDDRHEIQKGLKEHRTFKEIAYIICIFRKNRALAPHERSAVPLGTDHCPVG